MLVSGGLTVCAWLSAGGFTRALEARRRHTKQVRVALKLRDVIQVSNVSFNIEVGIGQRSLDIDGPSGLLHFAREEGEG